MIYYILTKTKQRGIMNTNFDIAPPLFFSVFNDRLEQCPDSTAIYQRLGMYHYNKPHDSTSLTQDTQQKVIKAAGDFLKLTTTLILNYRDINAVELKRFNISLVRLFSVQALFDLSNKSLLGDFSRRAKEICGLQPKQELPAVAAAAPSPQIKPALIAPEDRLRSLLSSFPKHKIALEVHKASNLQFILSVLIFEKVLYSIEGEWSNLVEQKSILLNTTNDSFEAPSNYEKVIFQSHKYAMCYVEAPNEDDIRSPDDFAFWLYFNKIFHITEQCGKTYIGPKMINNQSIGQSASEAIDSIKKLKSENQSIQMLINYLKGAALVSLVKTQIKKADQAGRLTKIWTEFTTSTTPKFVAEIAPHVTVLIEAEKKFAAKEEKFKYEHASLRTNLSFISELMAVISTYQKDLYKGQNAFYIYVKQQLENFITKTKQGDREKYGYLRKIIFGDLNTDGLFFTDTLDGIEDKIIERLIGLEKPPKGNIAQSAAAAALKPVHAAPAKKTKETSSVAAAARPAVVEFESADNSAVAGSEPTPVIAKQEPLVEVAAPSAAIPKLPSFSPVESKKKRVEEPLPVVRSQAQKVFPYKFNKRVHRWHAHPFGAALPPKEFPEYKDLDIEAQKKVHIKHALPGVDAFYEMGIKGIWHSESSGQVHECLRLPAEITYKAEGKTERGVITYVMNETGCCYHKYFSVRPPKSILTEVILNTFRAQDYPDLNQSAALAAMPGSGREQFHNPSSTADNITIHPIFGYVTIDYPEFAITLYKTSD